MSKVFHSSGSPPAVVFATCNECPDLQLSDALVADALEAAGVRVWAAPWNGSTKAFTEADLIVVRSTWDYPSAIEPFRAWLGGFVKGDRVVNSPSLMRWNFTKRYLMRLAADGAPLPPTRFAAPTVRDIAAAMDDLKINEGVVKPIIGATASGLSRVRRDDQISLQAAAERLGHACPGQTCLVQPLIAAIATLGETSMVYINGEFTHAVLKRPQPGDIRVQEEHGGATKRTEPTAAAIRRGAEILKLLPEMPLYARVDAVILDETLQLMEVELIEPELFYTHAPEAADRFAAALLEKLR